MGIGAIIAAHSTAALRRAIPAVIPLRTMERTPILPVHGASILTPNTGARKPALLAEIPVRNMQTTPTQTVTANATIAAQRFR